MRWRKRAGRHSKDQATIDTLIARLDADNLDIVAQIAALPDQVRGYGPVKEQAMTRYRTDLRALLRELDSTTRLSVAA